MIFSLVRRGDQQKVEEKGSEEKLENLETEKLVRLHVMRLRRDEKVTSGKWLVMGEIIATKRRKKSRKKSKNLSRVRNSSSNN